VLRKKTPRFQTRQDKFKGRSIHFNQQGRRTQGVILKDKSLTRGRGGVARLWKKGKEKWLRGGGLSTGQVFLMRQGTLARERTPGITVSNPYTEKERGDIPYRVRGSKMG